MLYQWAKDWNIPPAALADLMARTGTLPELPQNKEPDASESRVQSQIRIKAGARGDFLTRNNVGALLDKRGVPVRFGLMNETKELNKVVKSGDLIGGRRVLITPEMVGRIILQFWSVECKEAAWRFNPNDPHEKAQLAWATYINARGGYAIFANNPELI